MLSGRSRISFPLVYLAGGGAWVLGCEYVLGTHAGLSMRISLLLACGYQLLMIALRSGAPFAVLGAFRYASVLWAIAIGYVLWGDVPNLLAAPVSP